MQFSQGVISFFDLFYDYIVFAANPVQFLYKITVQINGKSRRQGYSFLVSSKHIFVRVLPLFTLRSAFTAGILASSREENLIYSTAALSCPVFRLSCIFRRQQDPAVLSHLSAAWGHPRPPQIPYPRKRKH